MREFRRIGYLVLICLGEKRTRGKKISEFIIGPVGCEVLIRHTDGGTAPSIHK